MKNRIMKSFIALVFTLITTSACANSNLYPYCNVFLGTTCFGVKAGDEYKFNSKLDFRTYEIKLSNGDEVNIYSGYHPADFEFDRAYLSKENIDGYLISALKIDDKNHRILIEPTKKRTPFVDINISIFADDKQLISEFIKSFKSCTRTKLATSCTDNILLQKVVL